MKTKAAALLYTALAGLTANLLISSAGEHAQANDTKTGVHKVNYLMLMGNNDKWNTKQITLTAYASFGLERQVIFAYKGDEEIFPDRCVWLSWDINKSPEIDSEIKKIIAKFGAKPCRVVCTGIYQSDWRGHLGLCAGELTLDSIRSLDEL